jgi:hypothetical protein
MKNRFIKTWPNRIGLAFLLTWICFSIILTSIYGYEIGKWGLLTVITVLTYAIPYSLTISISKALDQYYLKRMKKA